MGGDMTDKGQEFCHAQEQQADRATELLQEIQSRGLHEVTPILVHESVATSAQLMTLLPERAAMALLPTLEAEQRTAILKAVRRPASLS
jgi:hypothetical protein